MALWCSARLVIKGCGFNPGLLGKDLINFMVVSEIILFFSSIVPSIPSMSVGYQ